MSVASVPRSGYAGTSIARTGCGRNYLEPGDVYAPGVAKSESTTLEVAGREVRLSNPSKVYFPKPGWTKFDIAQYYVELADAVVVHLR